MSRQPTRKPTRKKPSISGEFLYSTDQSLRPVEPAPATRHSMLEQDLFIRQAQVKQLELHVSRVFKLTDKLVGAPCLTNDLEKKPKTESLLEAFSILQIKEENLLSKLGVYLTTLEEAI